MLHIQLPPLSSHDGCVSGVPSLLPLRSSSAPTTPYCEGSTPFLPSVLSITFGRGWRWGGRRQFFDLPLLWAIDFLAFLPWGAAKSFPCNRLSVDPFTVPSDPSELRRFLGLRVEYLLGEPDNAGAIQHTFFASYSFYRLNFPQDRFPDLHLHLFGCGARTGYWDLAKTITTLLKNSRVFYDVTKIYHEGGEGGEGRRERRRTLSAELS